MEASGGCAPCAGLVNLRRRPGAAALVLAVVVSVMLLSGHDAYARAGAGDAEPPEAGPAIPLPSSGGEPDAVAGGPGTTVAEGGEPKPFVPGEVIVRFDSDLEQASRADAVDALGADVSERLPIPGARLLELPRGVSPHEAAAELEQQPGVRYAQPNYLRQAEALPNDPRMRDLWGLHNTGQTVNGVGGTPDADIDAPEAWNLTTGSSNVTVAVVDTGVAYDHPALQANIWANDDPTGGGDNDGNGFVDDLRGWDFVDDDNDPMEAGESHGTHVAGTIGARGNDANSIVGVNWNVKLMPLRVLGPNGGTDADIASAFVYAARNGARVVNASLGGEGTTPLVQEAVRTNPNTLYVVAAGNGGSDGVGDNNDTQNYYPCNIPYGNLICVAATDSNDQLTGFSNYGTQNVDLAAPGHNVLSSVPAYRTPLFSDFQDASYTVFDPGGWTISTGSTWSGYDQETADFGVGYSITDSAGLCWPGIETNGCYPANVNHSAISPKFSLSGMHDCTLSYWLWVDINPTAGYASERVSVIGDSDQTTAQTIHNWNGGPGSPMQNPWTDDFSAFEGKTGVMVQLNMRSDGFYDTRDGAHVDDITVNCRSSNYGPGDFDYFPGTSMATPHVAGVAALLLARAPALTVSQVRGALLNTGDSKPDLATATATGRRLNAAAAVSSVQPPPPPPPTSKISIADAKGKEGTKTKRNRKKKKLVFIVTRTAPAKPAAVKFQTLDGTATEPADYVAKSGTLSFVAGQTSAKVVVPLKGDKKKEPNETFSVQLSQATGAALLDPKATGTIIDDD